MFEGLGPRTSASGTAWRASSRRARAAEVPLSKSIRESSRPLRARQAGLPQERPAGRMAKASGFGRLPPAVCDPIRRRGTHSVKRQRLDAASIRPAPETRKAKRDRNRTERVRAYDTTEVASKYINTRPRERLAMNRTAPNRTNPSSSSLSGRPRRSARVRGGAAGYGWLSSARDRQVARDRNAAERARVEEMFASAPLPSDRRRARWAAPTAAVEAVPSQARLRGLPAKPASCPVCESTSVTRDEVAKPGGSLRLAECLHCDHRWTEKPARRFAALGSAMERRSSAVSVAR